MRGLPAALALIGLAAPAAAHSPMPGIAGFHTGLLHPFSTMDQLLLIIGMGLWLGGFGLHRLAGVAGACTAGLLAGLVLGDPAADPALWLYGLAAGAACLAALAPGRGLIAAFAGAAAAGFLLGLVSVPDPGPLRDRIITMTGAGTGALLGLLYLAGAVDLAREKLRWPFVPIALRILAAWTAAIAVMLLAFRVAGLDTG